jgi:hypothetical protein
VSIDYVGIAVPFTVEEIEHLSALASLEGVSLVDLIRSRVFGPPEAPTREDTPANDEDLTTMMALLEGIRIRAGNRRRD